MFYLSIFGKFELTRIFGIFVQFASNNPILPKTKQIKEERKKRWRRKQSTANLSLLSNCNCI